MRRELVTIGDVRQSRYRKRVRALRGVQIGQTRTNFLPPTQTQFEAHPPGTDLATAAIWMLDHFRADGVPSEHVSDEYVLELQKAFNADPLSSVSGGPKLSLDGGYGPNVHDLMAVLISHSPELSIPPVNTTTHTVPYTIDLVGGGGGLPAPPAPTPAAGGGTTPAGGGGAITPAGGGGVTPAHVTPAEGMSKTTGLLVVAAAAGLIAWLVFRKKKGGRRTGARPSQLITVRANPRQAGLR